MQFLPRTSFFFFEKFLFFFCLNNYNNYNLTYITKKGSLRSTYLRITIYTLPHTTTAHKLHLQKCVCKLGALQEKLQGQHSETFQFVFTHSVVPSFCCSKLRPLFLYHPKRNKETKTNTPKPGTT